MNRKYNDSQIIELHSAGLIDREIAERLVYTGSNMACLKEFVYLLHSKFGLDFTIKSDNCLYLKHSSNEQMYEILTSVNECKSMDYKCGSRRKTPLNGETPEKDNPVLNPQETEENAYRLEVMPNK